MTHTEESLMALAIGSTTDFLRLAIREVLAERDALAMQVKLKPAPMADCPVYCKTAVDLQAECERLYKDAGRYRWLRTSGQQQDFVCGVAWDSPEEMDAAIDSALANEIKP